MGWTIIISIWLIAIYMGGVELTVRSYLFFPLCVSMVENYYKCRRAYIFFLANYVNVIISNSRFVYQTLWTEIKEKHIMK